MRRILFALAAIFMFVAAGTAFAGVLTDDFYRQSGYSSEYDYWGGVAGGTNGTTLNDRMYTAMGKWGFNSTSSLNDRLLAWSGKITRNHSLSAQDNLGRMSSLYKGLMFYKSFQDRGTTTVPELSGGSVTATFTASRDSTHPATYFDANGVLRVTTTSNEIRNTQGYYDATGWHAAPGLLLEGASTNYALNSYFSLDSDSNGMADNWNSYFGTNTLETCSVNGISGGKSQKNAHTFVAEPTRYYRALDYITAASSFDASSGAITFTVSFWARGSLSGLTTNIANINFFSVDGVNDADAWTEATAVQVRVNTAAAALSTTEWRRFSYSGTVSTATTRRLHAFFLYEAQADGSRSQAGENYWFEIYGFQIEKQAYPSSFIPTTTAALTRNAEALSYASANNFPAPSGGNCLSFDGQNASGDDYVSIPNSATGNQVYGSTAYSVEAWVFIRSDGEVDQGRIFTKDPTYLRTVSQSGNNVAIYCKFDYGAGTDSGAQTTVSVSTNNWHHIVATHNESNVTSIYCDGVEADYSSQQTGVGTLYDDSGNYLRIGNGVSTGETFDGFIQCVRIYRNKALSAGEVTTAYAAGRYASLPVTGCTAQYLFNEGTGTTLTDSVAANNGTISGATWSKDTHSGTILLKYRPIMMPNEQASSYQEMVRWLMESGNNYFTLMNRTNADNKVAAMVYSNSNYASVISSALSSWTRYQSHSLVATFHSANTSLYFYIDGSSGGTASTTAAIPAGALGSTFTLPKSGSTTPMILESLGIWNRALSAAEVAAVYADQSR